MQELTSETYYLDSLPDDKLYQICEQLAPKDLRKLMSSYERSKSVCHDLLMKKYLIGNRRFERRSIKQKISELIHEANLITDDDERRKFIFDMFKFIEANYDKLFFEHNSLSDKFAFDIIGKIQEAINIGWPEFEAFKPLVNKLRNFLNISIPVEPKINIESVLKSSKERLDILQKDIPLLEEEGLFPDRCRQLLIETREALTEFEKNPRTEEHLHDLISELERDCSENALREKERYGLLRGKFVRTELI